MSDSYNPFADDVDDDEEPLRSPVLQTPSPSPSPLSASPIHAASRHSSRESSVNAEPMSPLSARSFKSLPLKASASFQSSVSLPSVGGNGPASRAQSQQSVSSPTHSPSPSTSPASTAFLSLASPPPPSADTNTDADLSDSSTVIFKPHGVPLIESSFDTITDALVAIQEESVVCSILTDIVHDIHLQSLNDQLTKVYLEKMKLSNEFESLSLQWSIDAPVLFNNISQINDTIAAIKKEIESANNRYTSLSVKLTSANQYENHLIHIMQQRVLATDVTLLPHTVVNRVLVYLRTHELIHCLSICHRWLYHFDRGSTYRTNTLLTVKALIEEKIEAHKFQLELAKQAQHHSHGQHDNDGLVTHPPLTLTVPLVVSQLTPRPKSNTLNKAEILKHCLALQHQSLAATMATFESQSLAQQSMTNDKHIARIKLNELRDTVGRKRVLIGGMDEIQKVLINDRKKLVTDIKELEKEIKSEISSRSELKSDYQRHTKDYERRIQQVKELEEFMMAAGEKTRRQEVAEFRAEECSIQRELEQLRAHVEQRQSQKQEAERAIQLLRTKIRQVGW